MHIQQRVLVTSYSRPKSFLPFRCLWGGNKILLPLLTEAPLCTSCTLWSCKFSPKLFDWQLLVLDSFHVPLQLPQWLADYIKSFGFTLCFRQQFPFSFLDSWEISDRWLLWQGSLSVMNPFNVLSDIFMTTCFRVSTSVCWDGKNVQAEVFSLQIISVGFQWPNLSLVSEHSCHLGTSLLPKYTSWLSYYCHYR